MPTPVRTFGILLAFALLGVSSARALIIDNFSALDNNRFSSGFPSAPVENSSSSFVGANYDFSGVGWETASTDFAVTLISPQTFVTARHVAPANGSTVSFLNEDGVLKTYTVQSTSTVTYNSAGGASDLIVGTLSAPIAAADHVTSYPILFIGTSFSNINLGAYTQVPLLVYGKTGRVGTNTIEGFVNGDLYPLNHPDGVADSLYFYTDYDNSTGQTQAESGDSGSPTFATINGQLTLVGVHSSVGTIGTDPTQLTFDNFLAWPSILQQIADINHASSQDTSLYILSSVPEPAASAALLASGALAVVTFRRRRRGL